MAVQKRPSNMFLGLGYVFVAILILINYLGKEPERKSAVSGLQGKEALVMPLSTNENEILKKQLEEERSINREMRKMLEKMQMYVGTGLLDIKNYASNQIPLNALELEKILNEGIPKLADVEARCVTARKSFTAFCNSIASTRKNPFIPFYIIQGQQTKSLSEENTTKTNISADPMIPLILNSGSCRVKIYSSFE